MDSRTHVRYLLGLVALGSLLIVGRIVAPAPAARPSLAAELPVVSSVESADRLEQRERVLSIVRSYRRADNESECRTLAEAIVAESVAAGIDPLLVTSIVAIESSFRSSVVSHMGAVGLMQLRPFVARDVARRRDIEWTGTETLHTPHLNVRLGIRYYLELLERFEGDQQMALTAYNHGPTRVSRWVREGRYNGSSYATAIEALRARQ